MQRPIAGPCMKPCPLNPAATASTIFDTSVLIAPVSPVVNFGTGVTDVTMTQLRHLFTTGRSPTGENLVVVNRDSGSGTRNAFDNSIGLDPSWGIGDNTGPRNNGVQFDRLGPSYLPSNKQGNNRVEAAVIAHRRCGRADAAALRTDAAGQRRARSIRHCPAATKAGQNAAFRVHVEDPRHGPILPPENPRPAGACRRGRTERPADHAGRRWRRRGNECSPMRVRRVWMGRA